jgi:adenylate kinase
MRSAQSRFVLVGPPGSGKGTQAAWMRAHYKIPTISSSNLLREAVAAGTPLGREVDRVMSTGGLVTDEVMIELIRERLSEPDAAAGFVLDGFPRTVPQAEALDQFAGHPAVVAIALHVPEAEIERRLLARRVCSRCRMPQSQSSSASKQRHCAYCGAPLEHRDDDDEATIKRRLFVHRNTVRPLLEYYEPRSRLIEVDASAPVHAVSAEIARRVALQGPRVHDQKTGVG